jgi:hypothetical protein
MKALQGGVSIVTDLRTATTNKQAAVADGIAALHVFCRFCRA